MTRSVSLDQIALSLSQPPDKASPGHDYLRIYEMYFTPWRKRSLRFLEVGIAQGHSLPVWIEYFPRARVFGADIDIEQCEYHHERLQLWQMDQRYEVSLLNMAKEIGPWDIIIDDGSHHPTDSIRTFDCLWPSLTAGGIYCVEDLNTNYRPFSDVHPSMVEYIGGMLQDDLHGRGKTLTASMQTAPAMDLAQLTGREREIASIHLYRYLAIIQRR